VPWRHDARLQAPKATVQPLRINMTPPRTEPYRNQDKLLEFEAIVLYCHGLIAGMAKSTCLLVLPPSAKQVIPIATG